MQGIVYDIILTTWKIATINASVLGSKQQYFLRNMSTLNYLYWINCKYSIFYIRVLNSTKDATVFMISLTLVAMWLHFPSFSERTSITEDGRHRTAHATSKTFRRLRIRSVLLGHDLATLSSSKYCTCWNIKEYSMCLIVVVLRNTIKIKYNYYFFFYSIN